MNRKLPKWGAECRKARPNYDLLPGDCAVAIDSLTCDRGAVASMLLVLATPKSEISRRI
jgi:hypothetical protein